MLPMLWVKVGVARTREALIHQQNNANILRATNQAPSGLKDVVQAGELVGKRKALLGLFVEVVANQIRFGVDTRETNTDNTDADQSVGLEVDSLGKDAAEKSKTDQRFLRIGHEVSEKGGAVGLSHLGLLNYGFNVWVSHAKGLGHVEQVAIGWQENQIVAGLTIH